MNPRTVCFCQPIFSMISASVAPFFRWSMATTWAVLLPSRGPAPSSALAAFLALGAFLAALVFLVALALAGAPLAVCAPPLAFLSDFGFAGCAWGVAASPRPWMDSQIRLAATLAVLKLLTGFTPGRLFQMATSRSAGQPAASSASSFWLAKESKGVVVVAAASSWVPNAVMLLSESIVNVFMSFLLGATLCAVTTWITPKCLKSKAILLIIDAGEELAMGRVGSLRQVASDEGPPPPPPRRDTIRVAEGRSDCRLAHARQHRSVCAGDRCGAQHAAEMAETARVPDSVPGSTPVSYTH